MNLPRKHAAAMSALAILSATAHAQAPRDAVSGVQGVKQDAIEQVKPVAPAVPPPPIHRSTAQGVNKVDGVNTIDGVKATGQAPPPPPPPARVTSAGEGAVGSAGTIRAVNGVSGIDTAKIQNLEIAIKVKHGGETPAGTGAERSGKGKAAAAALLATPLEAPAKKSPKQDGRDGLQEFEKLQNRGS